MLEAEGIGGAGAVAAAKGATKAGATTCVATEAGATTCGATEAGATTKAGATEAEATKAGATTDGAAGGAAPTKATTAGAATGDGGAGPGAGGAATLALTMQARLVHDHYGIPHVSYRASPSRYTACAILTTALAMQALLRAIKDERGKSRGTRDALQRSMLC